MGPCDIKSSGKAWNDGVDAFDKAFKITGGNTTESIKFAIDEINKKHPDVNFDPKTFSDPIIKAYKESGLIPKNYKFESEKISSSEKKIEKIADKMNGLNPDEKKRFARKLFSAFEKDNLLDEQSVKNIYSDALGLPAMDEKVEEQIKKTSQALNEYKDLESEISKQIKSMQESKSGNEGKLTPEADKEYSDKFSELGEKRMSAQDKMMKEKTAFSNMLMEKKFWLHQLGDYMPLNLMNPRSLAKNISGAVVDGFMRGLSNSIASPVSAAASVFTGINSNPIGAKIRGAVKGKYKSKAAMAWKYGQTDFTTELPSADHFNASNRLRKAMNETGLEKFKGIISAVLKVHPSLISKGLTVPDAMAYEYVMSQELNRIAEARKLTGAEKEAFMLEPDEKSFDIASSIAKKATFKQDIPDFISKFANYNAHERSKQIIEKKRLEGKKFSPLAIKLTTGARALFQKSTFPFVKTPVNMVRTSASLLFPEYELAQGLIQAHKETDAIEKQRLIIESTSKAAVGFFIRYIAFQMVAQGLISGGFNDEDKKTKDIVEQELGGPNRINWSAFIRGLTLRDMKKQNGDNIIDLSTLGAAGMTMNVYSHAFSKYGKEEFKDRAFYNRDLLNSLSVPKDLFAGQITSSLDQTFLSGLNQIIGAIDNEHGFEANKYLVQMTANLFTGIVPSTAQQLSTQVDPNVKKQFDAKADFGENLAMRLGYNFAGQSKDLEDKYFSLAEKDKGAVKKKNYMLFDNYLGRVLSAELDFTKLSKAKDNTPVSRLYNAVKEVSKDERDRMFPASISKEISIQYRRGGKNKSEKVSLTEDQHAFLQNQASNYRMMLATPYIMSPDFEKFDFETRVKVLQSYYQEGLKYAKKDLQKAYPEIRSQKTGTPAADKKQVKKLVKKYKSKIN